MSLKTTAVNHYLVAAAATKASFGRRDRYLPPLLLSLLLELY
jgi:hypothetical protein